MIWDTLISLICERTPTLSQMRVIGGLMNSVTSIAGLQWIQRRATRAPVAHATIANISLSGPANEKFDCAVESLAHARVHVIASAGDKDEDACTTSPSRSHSAITVGATTIGDVRADYSNFGSVVGEYICSLVSKY
jgi:subtilisin family serine protease